MAQDIDLTQFHYYDEPQQFSVEIAFRGTTSLTVSASNEEEAREKAYQIIDADSFQPDCEEADDVDIDYVTPRPTRTYLITRPGSPNTVGTSHPEPGDLPREPTARDNWHFDRPGITPSWTRVSEGGAS